MFPNPEQHDFIYISIIAAIFAYGGMLTLGVPAFFILRAINHTAFWIAGVLGFAIGGLTWIVFFVLFGISLGNSLAFVWREAGNIVAGALGSIVGATLWLMPDQTARARRLMPENLRFGIGKSHHLTALSLQSKARILSSA
jgi:hypothetical protein